MILRNGENMHCQYSMHPADVNNLLMDYVKKAKATVKISDYVYQSKGYDSKSNRGRCIRLVSIRSNMIIITDNNEGTVYIPRYEQYIASTRRTPDGNTSESKRRAPRTKRVHHSAVAKRIGGLKARKSSHSPRNSHLSKKH